MVMKQSEPLGVLELARAYDKGILVEQEERSPGDDYLDHLGSCDGEASLGEEESWTSSYADEVDLKQEDGPGAAQAPQVQGIGSQKRARIIS